MRDRSERGALVLSIDARRRARSDFIVQTVVDLPFGAIREWLVGSEVDENGVQRALPCIWQRIVKDELRRRRGMCVALTVGFR